MYIARQPIFDQRMKIYGYELLFRESSQAHVFSGTTAEAATAVVLGGLFEQGIEKIVGSAKAFVNFDYNFLMSSMVELVDPDTLVIEMLENVSVDNRLLKRIRILSRKGYHLALDDFEEEVSSFPVVDLASIIKYDIQKTPLNSIKVDVRQAIAKGKILLAEKVESEEEYQLAKKMGFQLFQGYFFSKPKIISKTSQAKKSPTIVYTRILNELKKDRFSYDRIADMITQDVNLSYRLLYALSNTKKSTRYTSIRKALVLMGAKEIELWICVLMLQDISVSKPDEVFRMSLIRHKLGEYIAERSSFRECKDEISIVCLFSMLDIILETEMEEALEGLAVSEDVHEALVHGTGKFQSVCQLVEAYEHGDWETVTNLSYEIKMDTDELSKGYFRAIHWTNLLMKS